MQTQPPPSGSAPRRGEDRRSGAGAPSGQGERRSAERRSGEERRASPRL